MRRNHFLAVLIPTGILGVGLLLGSSLPLQAQQMVDPRSGRLAATATDLVLTAGRVDMEVRRTLLPDRGESGLLGSKWRLNLERRLVKEKDRVRMEGETGPILFTREGSSTGYRNPLGESIRIEKDGRAILTKRDGRKETFDPEGRLTEIDCLNYNRVNLVYGTKKRLARIDGPKKHFLKISSDGQGRIIGIESSNHDVIAYEYSGDDLSAVQINGAAPIRYQYDTNGFITKIEDPQTGAIAISYDAKGRVLSRRFADGGQEQHQYPGEGGEHEITDPTGRTTRIKWSTDGSREEVTDPLGRKTLIEYNPLGLPLSTTDALGNKTQMAYDGLARLISLTDGAGRTTRFEYLKDTLLRSAIVRPDGTKQINQYDVQMNLTGVRRENQTIFQQTHYPDGTVQSIKELGKPEERWTYDPAGRVATQGNAMGHQSRFEYDPQGNLIRKINPLGGVTIFKYDHQKRVVAITDPVMATTRYEYNAQGFLSKVIDPIGRVTSYGYDERGRLLTVNDPSGGTIRNEYDLEGRMVRKRFPNDQAYRVGYDLAGNVVEETNALGQTRRFTRDPLGRIIKESTAAGQEIAYEYDPLDNLISWKDNLGSGENLKYNLAGQLIERVTPQGASTRFTYDSTGNLTSMIDPRGKVKRFAYTHTGELSQAAEPDGSISRYSYDFAGRLSTIRHPGGGESRFTSDPLGNLISSANPLGKTGKKTYDQTGRLVSQTDAKGQTTRFVYDGSGRMVEKQFSDKTKVAYQYDPSGNLVQADDGQFPLRFSYNSSGFLTKVEYPVIKKNLMYTYDAIGLLQTLKDSDGNQIGYQYNGLKQLITIVLPDLKEIRFSYTPKNLLLSVNYPNGITGRWDYDDADRIIQIRYQDNAGKMVAGWTYTYDPAGNMIEQKANQDHTSSFVYDPAGQLVEETGPGKKIQYRYGPGGNRISVEENGAILSYQHDKADRIIKVGEEDFLYDGNGNLISRKDAKTQTTYEYNTENRLIKVSRPDGKITGFGYAPTGERVWRRDSHSLTYFIYDGYNLIQELGEKGNPRAIYVHGPGIDRPLAMLRDGQWYFYHPDRLGSIKLLTDSQGKITTVYDYDAFGKIRSQQGSIPNPFTYTGREREEGQDLYYYRARYYDPHIGRFLSPDVMPPNLGKPFSLNPYLYARNNPLRFIDPLGLDWFEPIKNVGIWDTPEECLEYWRMIKSRPDNPNHGMADQMIESTEKYIRDQGRRVPPPSNPAPAGGGGNVDNRPGTIKVNAPAGENRPGTIRVNAPAPGGVNAPSSGPGGITRPGFYGAVGSGLAAVGAAVNLQACLDEGRSKAYCYGQLGLMVGGGMVVGGVLVAGAAALSIPATAVALGGAALAGAGAWGAGGRWSQAPETRAQLEQQAAQQAQTEARVKNILANLEGRIGALAALGKEFCDAQSKASLSAMNAKNTAEAARKNVESTLGSLTAAVTGSFVNGCTENQKILVNLMEKVRQAEEWIDKAGRGYPEAILRLTRCASQKDVDDADYLLQGSTALSLSAERKVREALADIDALQKSIPKIKESVRDIQNRMNNLENAYLANLQAVDNYMTDTETFAKEAEGIIARFNAMKAELQQSASNLTAVIPPPYQGDLQTIKAKIDNTAPPCPVKPQEYVNAAKAAKESLSGGSLSSLSGIGSMLAAGSLAVQKLSIDSALNACGSLNPPSGREADNASLALVKLTNQIQDWLKTISEYRGLCLTKLYPKPQTPVVPPTPTTIPAQPSPACTYTYSGWSPCQPDGTQTRTVMSSSPEGCQGTPVLSQPCSYTPPPPPPKTMTGWGFGCRPMTINVGETSVCFWTVTYSDGNIEDVTSKASWNPGSSINGLQPGTVIVSASYQGTTLNTEVKISGKTCTYAYSGWSPCQPNGTQTRTVLSSSPEKCQGTPALSQSCTYTPSPTAPGTISSWAFGCQPSTIRVGETSTCSWAVVYSNGDVEEVTSKASWAPGSVIKGLTPGTVTISASYLGKMLNSEVKVVSQGYDPRGDPGLPGKDNPVDPNTIRGPMDGFAGGPGQGTRPEKPGQQGQPPIPIPTDYTKPPGEPPKPPDQPGTQPPSSPGGGKPTSPGIDVTVVGTAPAGKCAIVTGQLVKVEGWPEKIAGMTVTLTGPATKTATSGAGGAFSFSDIPAGKYVISVTQWNYGMTKADFVCESGKAVKVVIKGSCPYLYVWTGTAYEKENDIYPVARLLPRDLMTEESRLLAEKQESSIFLFTPEHITEKVIREKSMRDDYRITRSLIPDADGNHRLRIMEQATEHSFTDWVGLSAVDHRKGTKIGIGRAGQPFVYQGMQSLSSFQKPASLYNGDFLEIGVPPEVWRNGFIAVTWQGFLEGSADRHTASSGQPKLTLQRQDPQGKWRNVDWIYPRDENQESFFLLQDQGPGWDRENKIRIVASSCDPEKYHRVDDVSWGRLLPESPRVSRLKLLSAAKTTGEEVLELLREKDGQSLMLGPEEAADLVFEGIPAYEGMERSLVFLSEGFYVPYTTIRLASH
jgi:RHS repeat-associated protein